MAPLPRSGDLAMVAPAPPATHRSRPRRFLRALLVVLAVAVVAAGCGVGRSTERTADEPSGDQEIDDLLEARQEIFLDVTFDLIDQRIDDRVRQLGLPGAAYVVTPAEGDGHLHQVGAVDLTTTVPLAESSMWTTAAVLLTLVDEGRLGLDDPIGPHLPQLTGPAAGITLRQLLSHTSGLPATVTCDEPTPAGCDAAIARAALLDAPGEGFHVTELDAHVAARLAESVTGQDWAELFAQRIAAPAGMAVTSYADPATTGGLVAVDGTTTAEDLGRFLAVVRDGGRAGGTVVLSDAAVREMLLDQTVRLDTHTEPWVAETGVPTYGLGVWRDRLRGDDVASVVSAPNRYGLYPFVDAGRSAWGIVVVDDRSTPRDEVVSASALVSQLSAAALRRPPDD